jgi:uncharacterized RDD family membrane protein YckC
VAEPVEYDLSAWLPERRQALTFMLRTSELPFEWEGDHLVVPVAAEGAADAFIDDLEGPDDVHDPSPPWTTEELARSAAVEAPYPAGHPAPTWRGELEIASGGRRFAGSMIDGWVIGTLISTVAFGIHRGHIAWLGYGTYFVVATALWGQTLGKRLLGMHVIDDSTGRVPTWRQSIVRQIVPSAGSAVAIAVGRGWLAAVLCAVWVVIVYGAILRSARMQGVHDIAARTVVVRK